MKEHYIVTNVNEYHDDESYFLWTFFYERMKDERIGCPLTRPTPSSMITENTPKTRFFNPSVFMDTYKLDWNNPTAFIIPYDMDYDINDDKWIVFENKDDNLIYSYSIITIIELARRNGHRNVLIRGKEKCKRYEEKWKSLDGEKRFILENEKYDDYYYYERSCGGLWCSGISMSEDRSSCDEYQRMHMECCETCTNPFKANYR